MKTLLLYAMMSISHMNFQGHQQVGSNLPQSTETSTTAPTSTFSLQAYEKGMVHFITISGRVGLGTTIIPISVTVTAPSREQAEVEAKKAILVMKNIFEQI